MTGRNVRIRWGEFGGYVIALGGLAALVCIIALPGPPYLISLAVMALGLVPVMLAFYELGGRTPERLARVALTIGAASLLVFGADTLALAAGLVTFDESRAATGAFAAAAGSMLVFGLWLAGAPAAGGSLAYADTSMAGGRLRPGLDGCRSRTPNWG